MISSTHNQLQADKIAKAISLFFHPLIIVIPTLIIAITQTGSTVQVAILWTLLAIAIVNIPMALLIFSGVRSGRYSDASVSIREQRKSIYAVGGTTLVSLLVILFLSGAPTVLTACLVSAVIALILGYVINRYTKISIHAAAIAGCAGVLLLTAPIIGVVLALFSPLVAWARIRLKHHTIAQILIGSFVPIACVFIVFRILL